MECNSFCYFTPPIQKPCFLTPTKDLLHRMLKYVVKKILVSQSYVTFTNEQVKSTKQYYCMHLLCDLFRSHHPQASRDNAVIQCQFGQVLCASSPVWWQWLIMISIVMIQFDLIWFSHVPWPNTCRLNLDEGWSVNMLLKQALLDDHRMWGFEC